MARAAIHTLTSFYSLFLMMIFMTYNGYLIAGMMLGMFTGHLFWAVFLPEEWRVGVPRPANRSCCT